MYVTKGGVIQKIVEDTYPYWAALGWSIDQNRDGTADGTGGGGGSSNVVVLTQAAYDALATKDPAVLYVITEA